MTERKKKKSTVVVLRDDGLTEVFKRRGSSDQAPIDISGEDSAEALRAYEIHLQRGYSFDDDDEDSKRHRSSVPKPTLGLSTDSEGIRHTTHPNTIPAFQARIASMAKGGRILTPADTQHLSSQALSSIHRRLAELAVPAPQLHALEEMATWNTKCRRGRGGDVDGGADVTFRDTDAFDNPFSTNPAPSSFPTRLTPRAGVGVTSSSSARPASSPAIPYSIKGQRIVLSNGTSCAASLFTGCEVDGGMLSSPVYDLSSPKAPIHPSMSPPPDRHTIDKRGEKARRLEVDRLSPALAAAVYGNKLRETADRHHTKKHDNAVDTQTDESDGDHDMTPLPTDILGAAGYVSEDQISRLMHNPKRVQTTHLPPEDYRVLRSLFKEMDADQSGYLELSEVLQYRAQYPRRLPEAMLYRLNLEDDGRVYFDDFLGSFFPSVPRTAIESTMILNEPTVGNLGASSRNTSAVEAELYATAIKAVYRLYQRLCRDFGEYTLDAYLGQSGPFEASLHPPRAVPSRSPSSADESTSGYQSRIRRAQQQDAAMSPQLTMYPHLYRSAGVPPPAEEASPSRTFELLTTRFHPYEGADSVFPDKQDDRTPQMRRFEQGRTSHGELFHFDVTPPIDVHKDGEKGCTLNAYQWYLFEKGVVEASRRAVGLGSSPGIVGDTANELFDDIMLEANRLGGPTLSTLEVIEGSIPPTTIQSFVSKLRKREVVLKSVLPPDLRRRRKEQQDTNRSQAPSASAAFRSRAGSRMSKSETQSIQGGGRSRRGTEVAFSQSRSLAGSEYQQPQINDTQPGGGDDSLLLFSSNPMVRATRRVSLCQPKGEDEQGSPNVHVLSTLEPNIPFLLSCPVNFKSFAKVLVGYFLTQVRNYAAVESRHATQRLEEDRHLVEDREERRLHAAVAEAQRALLSEYKHVQRQQKLLNRMTGKIQSPMSPSSVAMGSDDSDLPTSPKSSVSSPPRRRSTWALIGQEMGLKKAAAKQEKRPEEPGASYNTAEFGRRTIMASSKPFKPACTGTRHPPPSTTSSAPIMRSCVPRLQHHFHTLDDYQPSNPEVSVMRPYSPAFEAKLQSMQWSLMYPFTGDIRSYFTRAEDDGVH